MRVDAAAGLRDVAVTREDRGERQRRRLRVRKRRESGRDTIRRLLAIDSTWQASALEKAAASIAVRGRRGVRRRRVLATPTRDVPAAGGNIPSAGAPLPPTIGCVEGGLKPAADPVFRVRRRSENVFVERRRPHGMLRVDRTSQDPPAVAGEAAFGMRDVRDERAVAGTRTRRSRESV